MQKVLVTFKNDHTNLAGFEILTKEECDELLNNIKSLSYPLELYYGNSIIVYEDWEDFWKDIKFTFFRPGEISVIKRFFREGEFNISIAQLVKNYLEDIE